MNVLLSCGPNTSKIIEVLSKAVDNVNCTYYVDVNDFLHQSSVHHQDFNRMIITGVFIKRGELGLQQLSDYISNNMPSVEVILIVSFNDPLCEEYEKNFNKYFNSPLYTVMYIETPTVAYLTDAIKLSIEEIREKYPSFSRKDTADTNNKKSISSKVGEIKSGNKINLTKSRFQKNIVNSSESTENGSNLDIIKNSDEGSEKIPNLVTNMNTEGNNEIFSNSDEGENLELSDDASVFQGEENGDLENSEFSQNELDLSVGEYGSQHYDSGFIGDDDIEELNAYVKERENANEGNEAKNTFTGSTFENVIKNTAVKDNENDVKDIEYISENISVSGNYSVVLKSDDKKVSIVMGLKGSGATYYVVDLSMKYVKEGKKVLIIDLDLKNNGILSFIDTKKFYNLGCNKGILKNKVYTEDGVDILSNGYDNLDSFNVNDLLTGSIINNYDVVLVDIPLEDISCINDDIFTNCNVIMCCISDLSKLIETSAMLYDRSIVSFNKEKYISNSAFVANKNISVDDVNTLKSEMLFPNGCWLNNL